MKSFHVVIVACLSMVTAFAEPISDAIDAGDQNALIKLSDSGTKEDGMTPLFLATLAGNISLVQALLATTAGKASVNDMTTNPDFTGWTALHAAAFLGSWNLLQMLWKAGARPPVVSESEQSVESLIADEVVKKSYMTLLASESAI